MKKRMLSLLIALCMALSLMPVTAFADDVEATHVTVKTAEELISAVEAATDGTVISVEGTIEVSQTLYVKSSVHLPAEELSRLPMISQPSPTTSQIPIL